MPPHTDLGLAHLRTPDEALHSLDVVFIHGLNGHRSRTWTNAKSELWPLWVGDDLRGARILTYGYDASIIVGSKDHITLHTNRLLNSLVDSRIGKPISQSSHQQAIPIIFIAHSLGGIIIKSCMNLAYTPDLSYSYIFLNTTGIVFLGTPHRGSQWANRLFLAQFSFSLFIRRSNFVELLKAKSSDLATITEIFNNIWGTKPVLSCYEKSRVMGVGKIVKEEDAATNCREEKVIGIDADHHEICKPSSKEAKVYQEVLSFLRLLPSSELLQPDAYRAENLVAPEPDRPSRSRRHHISTLRKVLWDQIRQQQPPPGCDTWNTVRDDWISDDGDAVCKNWQGGSYICSFPPGGGASIIQIEIDTTAELYPIVWVIQTAPDAEFYPGKHAGRIEIHEGFPMKQPWIAWDTPIFSPFVRFSSGPGFVSSPFDLGNWTPFYTIQHLLQTIACILTYDPLCRTDPPISHGNTKIPFQYHTLCHEEYCKDEDRFFHTAQFFSRVYNRVVDRTVHDPLVDESQRQASKTAIREMVDFYCKDKPPIPSGRDDADFERAFDDVLTNDEWVFEERCWADALSRACGFGFV